jgi:hypothetical protein
MDVRLRDLREIRRRRIEEVPWHFMVIEGWYCHLRYVGWTWWCFVHMCFQSDLASFHILCCPHSTSFVALCCDMSTFCNLSNFCTLSLMGAGSFCTLGEYPLFILLRLLCCSLKSSLFLLPQGNFPINRLLCSLLLTLYRFSFSTFFPCFPCFFLIFFVPFP